MLGREHDIADLHYTAAHDYDPDKAQFQDFNPFWEFVSGPVHAGSFGPGDMDSTFGPQVVYTKNPGGKLNLPPREGLQFFGVVKIDGETEAMTVPLKGLEDQELYSVTLEADGLTFAGGPIKWALPEATAFGGVSFVSRQGNASQVPW